MNPNLMMTNENLFKLQCLLKTTEIQHSAQCKLKRKLLLAQQLEEEVAFSWQLTVLILSSTLRENPLVYLIKRIPWFQAPHKQIAAFCFNSCGAWLLCVTLDGSLYIIPALALVGESQTIDR